jgi:hypothetical protein
MKHFKTLSSLLSLSAFLVIFSTTCSKPCIESRGIEGAGLTISFFNTTTNEYIYPVDTSLSAFRIDSLRVKDSKDAF